MEHHPLRPNDIFDDCIVIASGDLSDDYMAYLLLRRSSPYYRIVEVRRKDGHITTIAEHKNIHHAIMGYPLPEYRRTVDWTMGFADYGFCGES